MKQLASAANALAVVFMFPLDVMSATVEPAVPGYTPTLRLDAKDEGVILRHGDGPHQCDINGAREPTLIDEDGKYFLFYDGGGPKGWLACLATSTDLKTWTKHGAVLDFGKPGEPDAGSALSPWFVKEGDTWHMYYVTAEGTTGPPGFVAAGPYNSGHASSKSLMGPWAKTPNYIPVKPKPPGAGYPQGMAYPGHIVKKPDGEFLMFFGSPGAIGIARTRDLLSDWKPDAGPLFDRHFDLENSSVYFEPENKTWFLFVNHIKATPPMFTDAIWVFWTKDLEKWDSENRAIAFDGMNCTWSTRCIGMATVTKVGNRLAMVYDAAGGESIDHLGRDIGLAWYDLPLAPPANKATEARMGWAVHPFQRAKKSRRGQAAGEASCRLLAGRRERRPGAHPSRERTPFSRPPTDSELTAALQFIAATSWDDYAHALLCSNEFAYLE